MSAASPIVSIIFAVTGAGYESKLETAVKSIRNQTISPEIIISEYCHRPLYADFARQNKISYVPFNVSGKFKPGKFNIGAARNAGICCATGKWIYSSDADVVYPLPDFFEKLLDISKGHDALIFPPMKRVQENFVDTFLRRYEQLDFSDVPPNDILSVQDGKLKPPTDNEIHTEFNSKRYVTFTGDYKEYRAHLLRHRLRQFSPWKPTFHYGGIMAPRELFVRVGGYCERFSGWGADDVDMIWKLEGSAKVLELCRSDFKSFVFHLDHRWPYYSRFRAEKNRFIHKYRKRRGIESAIAQDREKLKKTFELAKRNFIPAL